MQEHLKIALIQADLFWENPKKNRKHFSAKIENILDADIIVLPEMFSTGFTMNAKTVAETMEGKTVAWMLKKALKTGAAIMGSLIVLENDHYYNRLLFVEPAGKITTYDKRHTFTLAGENTVFSAGNEKVIIAYKGWKICPLVCYDLRFPVWARNVENYDVLIYVANWPKARILAWDTLLKARAIENVCYVVGVNRVGIDETENEYSGNSAVYDVLGNAITNIKPNKEQVEIATLDQNHIHYYRNKLKFLDDKDAFTLM